MNRILVVCTANVVRSPFAAAALSRAVDHECEIDSAGLAAVEGQKVPVEILQDMRRYVMDLSKHRSRLITRDDVKRSTLILGMTEAHRDALQNMVPSATPRTFTLPEFARLIAAIPPLSEFDADLQQFVEAAHHHRPKVAAAEAPENVDDPQGQSAARTRECIDYLADLAEQVGSRLA